MTHILKTKRVYIKIIQKTLNSISNQLSSYIVINRPKLFIKLIKLAFIQSFDKVYKFKLLENGSEFRKSTKLNISTNSRQNREN